MIKTPMNQILALPTFKLALALAFEWDCQGDYIRPISMPLVNKMIEINTIIKNITIKQSIQVKFIFYFISFFSIFFFFSVVVDAYCCYSIRSSIS
jgi:chaperone required for assembly of F1-ATPase